MKYGLGHRPDPPDKRDWSAVGLPRLVGSQPDSVDYLRFIDHVRFQDMSSSCVGQSAARAFHIAAQIDGFSDAAFPSALALYAFGRAEDGPPGAPLADVGSQPRLVFKSAKDVGLCPESVWEFAMANVDVLPPPDVMRASADYRLDAFYRIFGYGADRCAMLRQALASGYPSTLAFEVFQNFEDFAGGGTYDATAGAYLGGHQVAVIGYRPGAFLICNSWGTLWGHGGLAWVSDAFVGSPHIIDTYAVTIGPNLPKA